MEKHIRFTLENSDHVRSFCVLEEAPDYEAQFEKVFSIEKGYGFSIRLRGDLVDIYDYFAGEARATFHILAKEETTGEIRYQLQREGSQ